MIEFVSEKVSTELVLSPEENNHLATLAKYGDNDAKEKVILGNLRLVVSIVNKYKRTDEEFDDLFQEGVFGLMRAIDTFNEELSLFSTHAYSWIKAMIYKSFKNTEIFHYDSTFYNKLVRYKKLSAAMGESYTSFTSRELREFDLTQDDVDKIQKFSRKAVSLDDMVEVNGSLKDIEATPSIEDIVYQKDLKRVVSEEMERILTPKELFVIRNTYGIGTDAEKMTNVAKMMAEEFNCKVCTRQRIRQIRVEAESKLRNSEILRECFLE